MELKQTPSQTVGPYFAYCMTPKQYGYPFKELAGGDLTTAETAGQRIRIAASPPPNPLDCTLERGLGGGAGW